MMKYNRGIIKRILTIALTLGILMQSFCGALIASADEVTDTSVFSMKYYNGTNWVSFENSATASSINGIRLTTNSSKDYYLQYQTLNNGKTGFYSTVNSNNTSAGAYAGTGDLETTQRAIQLLRIRVLKTLDNSAIHSGIVVMYRVKADGEWLSWVSNADPEWMQSVKSKYNLDGTLDTSSSYAGKTDCDIEGIEIRLYEETDLVASNAFEGTEASATTSYISNGGSAWVDFSKKAEAGAMDRIKIQTGAEDYYLTYQTKNEGAAGFYSAVSSKNSSDYAGADGKPIELLRINAYTSGGAKLRAGVVVMYRVKIETGWLSWVSNADPEYMISVKERYGLDGALDTRSSYAGKNGYSIIGVEIRIFKGDISNYEITDLSGTEYKPTMWYATNNNTLNSFETATPIQSTSGMISAIKINTATDKQYYLSYSVQASGQGGYYSAVNSNSHTANDYAGVYGKAIQALKIKVYNSSGTATLTKGIVVMYRVYTDKWLSWVSNADPEWMQSVKIKYGIEGALDTKSGYAGIVGQNIKAVEIRIFEENEIVTSCGSKDAKTINAPYIYQIDDFPTGCESVSAVMALQKAGVNMTVATLVDRYLDKSPYTRAFDPNTHFGGNPRLSSGMGCYAPVIMEALTEALAGKTQYAKDLTGTSISNLCSQYIDNGIPVIMWATMEMRQGYTVDYNSVFTWKAPEHCLLLVGYDSTCYIFHDPMKSAYVHYIKADVEAAYAFMGSQAIVVLKGTTPSAATPPANTNPSTTPSSSAQEYKKPNSVKESQSADPVDLSTGSHIIEHSIISLFGGNKTAVSISYNSSQLVSDSMGTGWNHNFEKRLEATEENILIYDSPSVYSVYEKESDTVYNCITKGKENYIITLNSDGSYVLDCNKNEKMYFDAKGKLTATEDKQGFKTNLTYTENSIVITDAINGSITLNLTDGFVTSITDGIRTAEFTYSNGYLIEIKDVNGSKLYYTYNADGLIETGSDDNGTVYFVNTYENGRIKEQVDGSGENAKTVFSYTETEEGLTVTVTNRNGDTSTRVFNSNGLLTSYTDENGNTTTYTYDENLNLASTTDANSNTESTVYNEYNLPIRNTDKNGNITTFAYDENHNIVSIIYGGNGDANKDGFIDARDIVRSKKYLAESPVPEYDVFLDMNLDNSVNASDIAMLRKYLLGADKLFIASETFTYNERNQLLSACDLNGTMTAYAYDNNALPYSKTVGDRTEFYTYADGKLIESTDANGNKTVYEYNSLNQVQKQIINVTALSYTDKWWGENTLPPVEIGDTELPDDSELYSIEQEEAHTTEYSYDNKGNVLTVTDSIGNTVTRTYDGNSLVTSETDANGNTTFYSYNGNMKLLYVTFCDGTHIFYDYDGEDRIVSIRDQRGNVSYTEYDKAGRVTRKSDAEKNTIEYSYDNAGNVLSILNSDGGVNKYTYDANGNVLTAEDTLGNVTINTYDRFNRLVASKNAMDGVTSYTYTVSGNLLKVIDPLGNATEYTYDIYGNKLAEKDANGNITEYTYDKNNNLLTVTDALGNVTTNIYDEKNRLIETRHPDNSSVAYTYDAADRLVCVTDALGNTVTYTYDPNGNVLTVTDGKGIVQTTNVYDSFNRVDSTTTAAGAVTDNTYDANGNLLSVTDTLGNKQSYVYDALNRAETVTDKSGSKTSVSYDSKGNILVCSLDGATTNYTYDTNGNMLSETTSSGGLVQYTYNVLSLKAEQTNARGQTRVYSYDKAGRITGYTSPEGAASFIYDNNGNILTATDQNGTVTRTFDELNRVKTYTDTQGKTIVYEYDSMGRPQKLTYPDNTAVTYGYDLNGNLIKVTDWAGRTTVYTYDENNNITAVTKPDGSVTETRYDNAQRVVYTAEAVNGSLIVGYEYGYDTEGRILTETDLAANVKSEYTYDSLSRVTNRKITNLTDNTVTEESYTYDANGNILRSTVSTEEDTFVYDTNNRLTSYNGQAVTYDLDGNMLSANGMSLTYDSANRLLTAGGNTYTYDVENTRVKNLCDGVETVYTYNTNTELSQLLVKTSGNVVTKYVYGNGLIGEETAGAFKTYHFDYRGSTVAITNENGTVTDTFDYDSYGNLMSRTGTTETIFLYNGEYGVITDSNGLLYMRARYYSPELRRFVNADILMGDINNSTTLNRYAYANGNPISNIDPFGLAADESRGGANNNYYIYDGSNTKFYPLEYYEYIDSKAYNKIVNNLEDILYYANRYEVDPSIVAGVIFVEQYYNYDWKDVLTDWIGLTGVIDMSIGLGQVRMSTAKYLEDQGYVTPVEIQTNENNEFSPYLLMVHSNIDRESLIRGTRLENDTWNINYVAAYIKALEDLWKKDFPEISSSPDILGTLYNLGHEKKPNSTPKPNWFGEKVGDIYNMMGDVFQ